MQVQFLLPANCISSPLYSFRTLGMRMLSRPELRRPKKSSWDVSGPLLLQTCTRFPSVAKQRFAPWIFSVTTHLAFFRTLIFFLDASHFCVEEDILGYVKCPSFLSELELLEAVLEVAAFFFFFFFFNPRLTVTMRYTVAPDFRLSLKRGSSFPAFLPSPHESAPSSALWCNENSLVTSSRGLLNSTTVVGLVSTFLWPFRYFSA
mmetsp:Transcript_16555/g.24910  ORF Transcript_16555/g.24910 Transcript_16555/m.24910 type:complete len:205 (-) Transcript_16555:185-799(-)